MNGPGHARSHENEIFTLILIDPSFLEKLNAEIDHVVARGAAAWLEMVSRVAKLKR